MIIEWFEELLAMMDAVSLALASLALVGFCIWVGWFACSHAVNAFRLAFGEDDKNEGE